LNDKHDADQKTGKGLIKKGIGEVLFGFQRQGTKRIEGNLKKEINGGSPPPSIKEDRSDVKRKPRARWKTERRAEGPQFENGLRKKKLFFENT